MCARRRGRARGRALGVDGHAVDAEEHGLPARALAERVGQALAHELNLAQAQRARRGAVGRAVGGRVREREVVQLLRPVAQRPPQAKGAVLEHHLRGRRPRVGTPAPVQSRRGPGGICMPPAPLVHIERARGKVRADADAAPVCPCSAPGCMSGQRSLRVSAPGQAARTCTLAVVSLTAL